MNTPKRRKSKGEFTEESSRMGPEGESIISKKTANVVKSPKTPKSKPKTPKKTPGSENENKSPVSAKKRKASLKQNLKQSASNLNTTLGDSWNEEMFENNLEEMNGSAKKRTPNSDKKKIRKIVKADDSFEQAVKRARGSPDGVVEPKESSQTKSKQTTPQSKGKQFEKGKKKPFKKAGQKLKSFAGKTPDGAKKNTDGKTEDDLSSKERKKQRKMQKGNYDIAVGAKKIWEQVRRHDITPAKRHDLCTELQTLIKGKAKELIFAHDTARVIQCLMKYGSATHKSALFEELREEILPMAKSKYAKFFVRKLLKYGTKAQRNYVYRSFHGHVRKLVKHHEAAELVEFAYNEYANAAQRSSMIEEFYGPSFKIFKSNEMKTLGQILEAHPEKKEPILNNMKEALTALVDKSICQYSIVHRIFMEYFTHATEKYRTEMIETVRESLIHMLHTRDGSRVAMQCLWYGTSKDRKVIVKSMKTFVSKICKEEYGHLVLLVMFDVVDDTKLVQKAIMDEMMKSVHELAQDQYGRKVLLYLLSPRDPIHFHPDIVKILQQGDGNPTSKKDSKIRRQELQQHVSGPLIQYVASHCKELVMNNSALLLVMTILTRAKGGEATALKAIAEIAAEPFAAGNLGTFHIVEHAAGHIALKKIIATDKERIENKENVLFSKILIETVPAGCLKSWAACNRGCFTLVSLLEVGHPEVTAKIKQELKGIKQSLKKLSFKGAEILLQKI